MLGIVNSPSTSCSASLIHQRESTAVQPRAEHSLHSDHPPITHTADPSSRRSAARAISTDFGASTDLGTSTVFGASSSGGSRFGPQNHGVAFVHALSGSGSGSAMTGPGFAASATRGRSSHGAWPTNAPIAPSPIVVRCDDAAHIGTVAVGTVFVDSSVGTSVADATHMPPQASVRSTARHGTPSPLGAAMTVRVWWRVPSQVLEQADHSVQALSKQCTSHGGVPHSRCSCSVPHVERFSLKPGCCIERRRVCTPPPHVEEHSLHALQSAKTQPIVHFSPPSHCTTCNRAGSQESTPRRYGPMACHDGSVRARRTSCRAGQSRPVPWAAERISRERFFTGWMQPGWH